MLRSMIIGVSAIALTTAACAQEAEMSQTAEPSAEAESAKILDAKQVTTEDDAKIFAENEFLQIDQNGDGSIDKSEYLIYASIRASIHDPALSIPDEVVEQEQAAGDMTDESETSAAMTAEEQFADLSEGDEAISEMELVEKRVAQFDEADENDDAALDDEERQKFAALTTVKAPKTST